jgi:hypothetical protein
MAQRRNVDQVWITRVDYYGSDLFGIAKAEMAPRFDLRPVDLYMPSPVERSGPLQSFPAADVDDIWIVKARLPMRRSIRWVGRRI